MNRRTWPLLMVLSWLTPTLAMAAPIELTLDTTRKHQTFESWGATALVVGIPFTEWLKDPTLATYDRLGVNANLPHKLLGRLYDELVFDLNTTRYRLEIGPQVEPENDNADPKVTDAKAYHFLWQDHLVDTCILPLKQRVEAAGERLSIYVSYDLRSRLTPDFLLRPEEYAEMAEAFLTHLKTKYKLEPDYWSILNEPGNNRPGNPKLYAELTAATGARLAKAGFKTKMSGPEAVNISTIPAYVAALQNTPGALDHFGQLTYHLYHGGADKVDERHAVRDAAKRLNVTAAQTEWMEQKDINVARHCLLCLTEADAVTWERYGLPNLFDLKNVPLNDPKSDAQEVRKNSTGWHMWQFMHFIRAGFVRVDLAGSVETPAVAFVSPAGKCVLVLLNSGKDDQAVSVAGLPADQYRLWQTCVNLKRFGEPLKPMDLQKNQKLELPLPAGSVTTITTEPPPNRPAAAAAK